MLSLGDVVDFEVKTGNCDNDVCVQCRQDDSDVIETNASKNAIRSRSIVSS